jgi:hypothetical protein
MWTTGYQSALQQITSEFYQNMLSFTMPTLGRLVFVIVTKINKI